MDLKALVKTGAFEFTVFIFIFFESRAQIGEVPKGIVYQGFGSNS
jgi:hypothetical protein